MLVEVLFCGFALLTDVDWSILAQIHTCKNLNFLCYYLREINSLIAAHIFFLNQINSDFIVCINSMQHLPSFKLVTKYIK